MLAGRFVKQPVTLKPQGVKECSFTGSYILTRLKYINQTRVKCHNRLGFKPEN